METQELLDLYDPKKANDLTEEQIKALKDLTTEEIGVLAERYPNGPQGNYLVLINTKTTGNQLHPLSTFANLYALRARLNQPYWSILTFKTKFNPSLSANPIPTAKFQDLTKADLQNAEGLKTAQTQNVSSTPVVNLEEKKSEETNTGDNDAGDKLSPDKSGLTEEEIQQNKAAADLLAKKGKAK